MAGAIGAVVLTGSGCGASYQTVAEGDGEFNRCMRLDRDETVANEDRAQCWNAWQGTYANAQSPERLQFARGRLAELNGNQRGPSSGGQQGALPGYGPQPGYGPPGSQPGWGPQQPPPAQGGYGNPQYAQDPNARAPGPQYPPQQAQPPVAQQAPPPQQPAGTAGGPPGASCATSCQGSWSACGGACPNAQAACVARCDDAYRDCMRGCY
jgi:hypothetical protein